MAIQKFHQFAANQRYYTGQGCLVCGTNLGPQIDLGVSDQIDGIIALCEDHARECGVYAGMVSRAEVEAELAEAEAKLTEAGTLEALAAEEADVARRDREATERIVAGLAEKLAPDPAAKASTPKASK